MRHLCRNLQLCEEHEHAVVMWDGDEVSQCPMCELSDRIEELNGKVSELLGQNSDLEYEKEDLQEAVNRLYSKLESLDE